LEAVVFPPEDSYTDWQKGGEIMAKRRFAAYLEIDEEVLLKVQNYRGILHGLDDQLSRLKSAGIDVKHYREVKSPLSNDTVDLPLHIKVVDGKVTEIWYDSDYDNQDYPLNEGDFWVEYKSSQNL
jgi:hypothetical protein